MSHVLENHVVGCGLFFAVSEHHREPRVDRRRRRAARLRHAAGRRAAAGGAPPRRTCSVTPAQVFDHTTELLIEAIERAALADTEEDPE